MGEPAVQPKSAVTHTVAKRLERRLVFALIAAGVVVIGLATYWITHRTPTPTYITGTVTRGDVVTTIAASGTINPVVTVQVGSFVSGVISTLSCDFNTRVFKGQVCATIDPTPYQAVVDQDNAGLTTAKAQLAKDQASLVYARISSQRTSLLFKEDSGSHDAADLALSAYDQAQALVKLDIAQIAGKEAVLRAGRINLGYTNIVSPVNGTVVARNVNAGQTVAASFQTPTLFLIANDLTKMQVDTNVSESDIAQAVQGAGASFNVDAYPKRVFQGRVTQVRQAPISVQNVITYDVVIGVANPDLALKPGMTATTRITTAQALNVLRVPSQALRFTPTSAAAKVGTPKAPKPGGADPNRGRVWLMRAGKLTPIQVKVGLNDDSFAEITSAELKLGDEVIVSQVATGAAAKAKPGATPALHL
jgi:HlyD family secretion protein